MRRLQFDLLLGHKGATVIKIVIIKKRMLRVGRLHAVLLLLVPAILLLFLLIHLLVVVLLLLEIIHSAPRLLLHILLGLHLLLLALRLGVAAGFLARLLLVVGVHVHAATFVVVDVLAARGLAVGLVEELGGLLSRYLPSLIAVLRSASIAGLLFDPLDLPAAGRLPNIVVLDEVRDLVVLTFFGDWDVRTAVGWALNVR